ncbi:MAG TPA: MGMT family protein [Anaerolineae bacterium]|nr:MGMT family protein [Anaerolineae bacterium]
MTTPTNFDRIYALIRRIPIGKVASYGQIARWLGWPRGARTVGWALRALTDDAGDVPWHRVINSQGRISLDAEGTRIQRELLEAEGVTFDSAGRIDLKTYAWVGPAPWETADEP